MSNSSSRFFVRIAGDSASFCASGWSGYNKRLSLYDAKKIAYDEVYGLEQARQHVAELRRHVYNGKLHMADSTLEIVSHVSVETVVDTIVAPGAGSADLATVTSQRDAVVQVLNEMKWNIDVSTINNSKKSTARWVELKTKAEALIADIESKAT